MPKLNIAFDGRSSQELKKFVSENRDVFISGDVYIKVNDLLADIGVDGLKKLQNEIKEEIGIDIVWMIDGKWYDISNTVANYARRLEGLHVAYYTVHASGGTLMIRAAKEAAPEKKLLAITILTSLGEDEVRDVYSADRAESILRLAKTALDAGADGLVCSPLDAPMLRGVFGDDFLLVTPNIAREGVERNDDQNKTLTNTPRGAIENGASDIVVGRPILQAEHPGEVISEMLEQMNSVFVIARDEAIQDPELKTTGSLHASRGQEKFTFEKILHTGSWDALLKYIGAIYMRPEGGCYVRYTSGLIADAYTNMGVPERDYRVMHRVGDDLARQLRAAQIAPDGVIGAQMGSVRLSLSLAESLSIKESLYTEKVGDQMLLKRHELTEAGFAGRQIILSEDVITKGSTIAKMIEIVKTGGGEVVAVTCIVNRSGKDNFEGIPLFHCYVPAPFAMWWDDATLEKTRANELATGKSTSEIDTIIEAIKTKYPRIPEGAKISEKPKNEWNELVKSMR